MKTIPASLVLAGLLIPAILQAQPEMDGPKDPAPPPPPQRGDGAPRRGDRDRGDNDKDGDGDRDHNRERQRDGGKGWQKADADGSGTLTREEFNTMPRIQKLPQEKQDNIFKRLDKDGDNILSADELKGMERGPNERHDAMMRLRELDSDQSGGISFAEFKEGEVFKKLPPDKQEALFKRLDTDGDGQITPKDRPQPPPGGGPPGGKPGGGGGGGPRDPRRLIRDLDENKDGAVTFDEFRKAPPIKDLTEDEQEDRFEALDKNADKKLDATDFPPPPEKGDKPAEPKEPAPPEPAPAQPKSDPAPMPPAKAD